MGTFQDLVFSGSRFAISESYDGVIKQLMKVSAWYISATYRHHADMRISRLHFYLRFATRVWSSVMRTRDPRGLAIGSRYQNKTDTRES